LRPPVSSRPPPNHETGLAETFPELAGISDMAEEGTVEKLRIGRENVVRLPSDEE